MIDPKPFSHIKIPSTGLPNSPSLLPRSCPSDDSRVGDQLSQIQPPNVRAESPHRQFHTKHVPRLLTATSPSAARRPIDSGKLVFTSCHENHLRTSIAKLELLLHEAACLVDSAICPQQQERNALEKSSQNIKRAKNDQPTVANQPAEELEEESKAFPARPSTLTTKRGAKSLGSLSSVKAMAAAPVLSLPQGNSPKDIPWVPQMPHAERKTRLDVNINRQNTADNGPTSSNTQCDQTTSVPSSSSGSTQTCGGLSTALMEPLSTPEATPTTENHDCSPKVRFAVPKLSVPARSSSSESRKWRKPSSAPTSLLAPDESAGRGDEDSETETFGAAPLQQFDEPIRAPKVEPPKLRINGEEIDDWNTILADQQAPPKVVQKGHERHFSTVFGLLAREKSISIAHPSNSSVPPKVDLRQKSFVDVYHEGEGFNVHETCQHSTVARSWPSSRKRLTAFVACLNTSCIGLLVGIYAGEVPAIQYAIADFSHFSILGNVVLYAGLAISTVLFWPLPLLHGRKPYIIAAGLIALVLQVPQGLAVSGYRDPSTPTYKVLLLLSRGVSGFALGLSDVNMKSMLLDCFGASLQSQFVESDRYDSYDVRKHGGGMGIWLGLLSWSTVGPISIGFMAGASIIDKGATVAWGFWTSMCCLLFVLLLNVICPETRRSAFRRMLADLTGQGGRFSRIVRGEVKMHLDGVGPYWWGDEVISGLRLCIKMSKQPGFIVLSLYAGWVYAQYSLVLMLLGALASRDYKLKAAWVGFCTMALALGALLAAPFQRGSYFSRSRTSPVRSDSFTMRHSLKWSSHFLRRLIFMVLLPFCAAAYAASSMGPSLSIAAPCIMASLVGFFTTMATAECYGLIMEAFDTTDLQPGMTGRPIRASVDTDLAEQRTNFSCYPRIMAGFAITNALSYILAAAATAFTGSVQRREGTVWATTGVAIISVILTFFLTLVLIKWKKVQMIPDGQETLEHVNRANTSWRPVIVGRGSSKFRRLSIFEMGRMTRYSAIRDRNRIEAGLSGGLR